MPTNTPSIAREPRGELHDCIALALDAICAPSPSERNLIEARGCLRAALSRIGGAA